MQQEDTGTPATPTFVIVGGGASGCLVAAQLLRRARSPRRIVLVERREALCRGVAYSTSSTSHLLNVPADRMSAFEDDPLHFVRWLAQQGPRPILGPLDFAPRPLYGRYLQTVLEEAIGNALSGVTLEVRKDEAVQIAVERDGVEVRFRRSAPLRAQAAVLAVGNPPPAEPREATPAVIASGRWRRDPWEPGALEGIPRDRAVFLLGTGLTMVDAVLALEDGGHRGPLVAVSRRGLLPQSHSRETTGAACPPLSGSEPRNASSWLRLLRERSAAGLDGTGGDWREAVDGLRGSTMQIWLDLPAEEKRRFLRHLQPYWDVHRHRTAPEVRQRLGTLLDSGRLEVCAGRVKELSPTAEGIDVRWVPRGPRSPERMTSAAAVINCTGPSFARSVAEMPLVSDLLARGTARLDPLGLGLDATPHSELLSAGGEVMKSLLVLGPPLKGVLWESIAVPEIRTQAELLARRLLESLPSGPEPVVLPAGLESTHRPLARRAANVT